MTKFLADRMLGQTAKWLRLLGIDTKYASDCDDDRLIEIAENENRIIITRDKELAKNDNAMLVKKGPPEETISKILREFDIEIKPMNRCSKCNTVVKKVDKIEIKGKVLENIYERNDDFWICPGCDQIYWKGTHWDNIMEKIEEIRND